MKSLFLSLLVLVPVVANGALATVSQLNALSNNIAGGTAANWSASGTTNSSLTGRAYANSATLTNGITAGASTFTGQQLFSGTTHPGITLNNLTTIQRDGLLAAATNAGSLLWNTTQSRVNVHNGSTWTDGFVRLAGDTMTGALGLPNAVVTNQVRLLSSVLVQSGTNVVVDMATNSPSRRYVVATNDLNFTASNAVDGSAVNVAVYSGTTNRNLTFDTNWVWIGAPAPTILQSNKTARFTIEYWAGLTNYQCFYSPQMP